MSSLRPNSGSRLLIAVLWGCILVPPGVALGVLLSRPFPLRTGPVTRSVPAAADAVDPLLTTATPGVRAIHEAVLSARYFGVFPDELLYRIECDADVFEEFIARHEMTARHDDGWRERLHALAPGWFPSGELPETVFADHDPGGSRAYGSACCFDQARSVMVVWAKLCRD